MVLLLSRANPTEPWRVLRPPRPAPSPEDSTVMIHAYTHTYTHIPPRESWKWCSRSRTDIPTTTTNKPHHHHLLRPAPTLLRGGHRSEQFGENLEWFSKGRNASCHETASCASAAPGGLLSEVERPTRAGFPENLVAEITADSPQAPPDTIPGTRPGLHVVQRSDCDGILLRRGFRGCSRRRPPGRRGRHCASSRRHRWAERGRPRLNVCMCRLHV